MAAKPFKEQLMFISSKMFSFVDYDKEHGSVAVHVKIPEVTALALIVYFPMVWYARGVRVIHTTMICYIVYLPVNAYWQFDNYGWRTWTHGEWG